MTYEQFVAEVQRRGAFSDQEQVCNAMRATLEALGERLWESDARAVAECLPRRMGHDLRRVHCKMTYERDASDAAMHAFYACVAAREGVPVEEARRHAQIVCQVLTESVDEGAQLHLRVHLPDIFSVLFNGG